MFPVQDMDADIKRIQQGDSLFRESFLEACRPFVFKCACKFAKRILEWGRDDELAIALIAFNEAVDRFCSDHGVPFLPYARRVIYSRLIDHYRQEKKNAEANVQLPFSDDGQNNAEIAVAWDNYREEVVAREREEEIKEYDELLQEYGVSFVELVSCSPRHRETRQSLIRAAWELAEAGSLFEKFAANKKLPLLELQKSTGIGRKTLERGRKYIIAMAVLIYRRHDFLYLADYLKLPAPSLKEELS
ncbi:MAG: RNA polymerase sigma-I factor [Desulfotomaculaceae bacterium]|nr:RNA polymerase sigma-I factor [Desulfotomaculaceae bacterium]